VRLKGVIDGNQVNIPEPEGSDEDKKLYTLIGLLCAVNVFQEIAPHKTVPQTDTGGQVEYTKALERTMLKELGKLHL
jgi:hypothetical protein